MFLPHDICVYYSLGAKIFSSAFSLLLSSLFSLFIIFLALLFVPMIHDCLPGVECIRSQYNCMIQLVSNINQKEEYGSIDEFLPFGFIPQYFMLNSLSAFNFHTILNPVLVLAHQEKKT